MHLDLDALRALDAVVGEGSVARAAARLHKVQSAVSYQLRMLEAQLEVPLLDRSGYRIRLTAAGEAVLAEGRRLLLQAGRVETLARQFKEDWEPRLTLVVDGILPLEHVFAALRTLADERAPTRVQVKMEFLHGVQYRFEKDAADLMLVKDYTPRAWLATESLPEIEVVLCVAPGHPLAAARSVSLDALQEHVELTVQDSSEQGDDKHLFGGERVFYLSGFVAKKQALLMGLGFGWMPRYLVDDELRDGTLREVRYASGSRYRFSPLLAHRQDKPLGRAGRRLTELLRAPASATGASPTPKPRGPRRPPAPRGRSSRR